MKYRESTNGHNPFLLHVAAQSVAYFRVQIDMEVEEPETTENPAQSFEINNIIRRRTQLLAGIIYYIYIFIYIYIYIYIYTYILFYFN